MVNLPSDSSRIQSLMISLGLPYPDNVALASRLESIVRANGGVPATIAVFNGVARVGLNPEELIELASTAKTKSALKVSRRDLGYLCGLVIPDVSLADSK
jgi:pseudouridylate synthase / pseudouridine kinase